MTDTLNSTTSHSLSESNAPFGAHTRRNFLRFAAVAGAGFCLPSILAGCSDDAGLDPSERATFALSMPAGPLNMLYAHTLLMWDFYERARSPRPGYPDQTPRETFAGLGGQKGDLARVYKMLIPGGRITDSLFFNFTQIDFASREGVLGFAAKFETIGVGMAAGLVPYLQNPTDLLLVGQHASTCARHAAAIRSVQCLVQDGWNNSRLLNTDVLTADGKVRPIEPAQAAAEMQPYLLTALAVR